MYIEIIPSIIAFHRFTAIDTFAMLGFSNTLPSLWHVAVFPMFRGK